MWWAGRFFGARFMTDMIPFLTYSLILVFQYSWSWNTGKVVVLWGLFTVALMFSFLVQLSGAVCPEAWEWNVTFANIDRDTPRLQDGHDSQVKRAFNVWLQR
jgi:hypothetical protein